LQLGLDLAPFRIDTKHFVDFRFIAAPTRRKPVTNEIRSLPNQTDVEHGAV
jgi:hypothetical protein